MRDRPRRVRAGAIALAVAVVAVSARVSFPVPGSPVPQSLQTLAVLLVGGLLGSRDAVLSLSAYLLLGGAGAQVFADGASGWSHLVGPTAGYLAGFVVTGGAVGRLAERGRLRGLPAALGALLAGHAGILFLGWLRLGAAVGFGEAFRAGVRPFLVGGAVKSAVGAGIVVAAGRYLGVPADVEAPSTDGSPSTAEGLAMDEGFPTTESPPTDEGP